MERRGMWGIGKEGGVVVAGWSVESGAGGVVRGVAS